MSVSDLTRIIERHEQSMSNALVVSKKVDDRVLRAERVMDQVAQRDGAAREAARRERQRLNAGLAATAKKAGLALLLVSAATIGIGMVTPIGMFGFLAAIGIAVGLVALILFGGSKQVVAAPNVPSDLPNADMVGRFDSYLYRVRRALPRAAQAELDPISAMLPGLRQTLGRLDTLDSNAQDARRLMSMHLPGLIDRYLHVPANYRDSVDGEGKTVDQRLVEGLAAGREALAEIGEKLARADVAAFETHGRFMETRYRDNGLEG